MPTAGLKDLDMSVLEDERPGADDAGPAGAASTVSWGAVLAGAAVAAAVSLLLFALATGLDLAALSSTNRATPDAWFTVIAAVALIVAQWIPASLGGYITGRLRTRWIGTHTHEVFFRDSAHGFLTWCVATVFMASGLGSGLASSASHLTGADRSGGAAAHTAQPSVFTAQPGAFGQAPLSASVPMHSELVVPDGPTLADVLDTDRTHVARPAATLGADPEPGDARRPEWDRLAWQASDAERRDAAAISILTALSMLVGACIASVSAALGGRMRDLHP
jgi:hypothetical protein